jgi:hypothetical protein
MGSAIWHGTPAELARLEAAVQRHCACPPRRFSLNPQAVCSAHALLGDPRLLDHLLYAYRVRARFIRGEWSVDGWR